MREKIKKKKCLPKLLSFVLLFCLLLGGCGGNSGRVSDNESDSTQESDSVSPQSSPETSEPPIVSADSFFQTPSPNPNLQTVNQALDENDENVIVLGCTWPFYKEILKFAEMFNDAQSQYKVKVKGYGDLTDFVTDLLRGKGADLFSVYDLPVETLTKMGILEDLTPYSEASDVGRRENIVNAVWEAGTVGGQLSLLIPAFYFEGMIVEKGHTDNGGWTMEDYLALAEQYPEGMINRDIADPKNLFFYDLMYAPEIYIDWEAGTCNFDSSDFINLLKQLKKYGSKTYDIAPSGTLAERLYKREYLTLRSQFPLNESMFQYLQIRDLLGDEFEYAGYPGLDGELSYRMIYFYAFGMSAFSSKKEGAWAFLEYLLSEELQRKHMEGQIPARLDLVNQILQDALDFDPGQYKHISAYNSFTEEIEEGRAAFTEEDRQAILNMIDHTKRFSVMSSGEIAYIILGELKLYFDGSKTAEDTAAIIQNRVQLYLDEMG